MVKHTLNHTPDVAPSQTVTVGQTQFGSNRIAIIAGPCAVESYEQLSMVAATLKRLGIPCLRGGIYKPRTSPYSFQGLREEGLPILQAVRRETGLAIVSEILTVHHIDEAGPVVDCFQVGARNMQNFELLKALGRQPKPVILKRGLAATLEEFLLAAEYILAEGNNKVILCERGIRGFDRETRNVLDLASVARLKELTGLPVIADPSHGTGRRSLVASTAQAAVAVGADGLMIEVHPQPDEALSDGAQSLNLDEFQALVPRLGRVAEAVDRSLQKARMEVAV